MTMSPDERAQTDDALIESLLVEMYRSRSAAEDNQRIANVMASLDQNSTSHQRESLLPVEVRRWLRSWSAIGLAACLLIAIGYGIFSLPANQAYAAVDRCIAVAPATRTYRLKMLHQSPIWGDKEVNADLYFDDRDHFVFRHPGLARRGPIWIGGGTKERWVVPAFGPAYAGSAEAITQWLANRDVPTPYLHVVSVLNRMRRFYSLKLLDNEFIDVPNVPQPILCRHVVGTIKNPQSNLPATIHLWASIETGVAQQVELKWNRAPNERGPVKWFIQNMGTNELPQNWFEVEGHVDVPRRIIRIDSEKELEDVEK
jgi:hypothetical protein